MRILVTGSAGFIGYHVFKQLRSDGHEVFGIDNLNNYYDVNLKFGRLQECGFDIEAIAYGREVASSQGGCFIQMNLESRADILELFRKYQFDVVCHLAAQAGVRYSVENPQAYIDSNIVGFLNIIEGCRHFSVKHLVFASSSSVYGENSKVPFAPEDNVDRPISLYAATKKSDELIAYSYSHLFQLPVTGLRFFTVYGPWGRPDMALFKFTRFILQGRAIPVYNHGKLSRDFTYIDDIVEGVRRIVTIGQVAAAGGGVIPPYRIYNIGNGHPVQLLDFIQAIEDTLGMKAQLDLLPLQPGDVLATWADTTSLQKDYNYSPQTSLQAGVGAFVNWYRNFYHI